MARAGVKNELFDCLGWQRLSSSNWLLLGIQNCHMDIGDTISYHKGTDSIIWYLLRAEIRRGYGCEIKHKNRDVYTYEFRILLQTESCVSVTTPYFSYEGDESAKFISMRYLGTKEISIRRHGKDVPLIITVKSGPYVKYRKVQPPKMTLVEMYRYCYNLMVLINGGPLEI